MDIHLEVHDKGSYMARVEKLLVETAVKALAPQFFLTASSIIHSLLGICEMALVLQKKNENYSF